MISVENAMLELAGSAMTVVMEVKYPINLKGSVEAQNTKDVVFVDGGAGEDAQSRLLAWVRKDIQSCAEIGCLPCCSTDRYS